MAVSTYTPVAQLVTERPARARIFERLGIDYCCNGDRPLAEACRKNDLDPNTVAQMLDVAADATVFSDTTDWSDASLSDLIDNIVETHHAYLRRELSKLENLLMTVTDAHGDEVSWLDPTLEVFQTLKLDVQTHIMTEEERVFPSIRALEQKNPSSESSALDRPGVEQMIKEHDDSGAALERLRDLTNDYTPPEEACSKFHAAMEELEALEKDMHRHIHKENHILFPRARSLAE
jgi:regulator of cell morphogenesis and NO signaling